MYESLYKIYHKYPEKHDIIYRQRFNAPTTRRFAFFIKEHNRREAYPAFLCYTEELSLLFEEIYVKHEQLLQLINTVPPLVLEQFILFSVVDEVRATSDIEGIHSTRREIEEVVDGFNHSARFSSIVAKYKELLNNGQIRFDTCEEVRHFYDDFAHKEVIANEPNHQLDGKLFRRDSVEITSSSGKVLHSGAYPEERIIALLRVALDVLNSAEMPLLVRIAVFHYFFAYIHPFYNGNGRTARFIVSYFLARRFHYLIGLRLSVIIKKHRKQYYDLFRETDSEWNCGDLTPFVLGFTTIVSETFDDIAESLSRKVVALKKHQARLLDKLGNGDILRKEICQVILQASVFFGSGISIEDLMRLTGKSRNTIKARINSMPANYLIKVGTRKIRYKINFMLLKE